MDENVSYEVLVAVNHEVAITVIYLVVAKFMVVRGFKAWQSIKAKVDRLCLNFLFSVLRLLS